MRSKLKILREQAGLTQHQMAIKLGYKYTSGYNQLETGKRRIDINVAKKISEILKKPLEEIFFDNGVVTLTTKDNYHDQVTKKAI